VIVHLIMWIGGAIIILWMIGAALQPLRPRHYQPPPRRWADDEEIEEPSKPFVHGRRR